MTHEDLIRGSQAILDFLLETQDDDWTTRSSFMTPKMSIMDDTLSEIIGKGKSIKFFNSILRDKKINQILS